MSRAKVSAIQRSMRLNDPFRLILEMETDPAGRVVLIVGVEDYH
ncbi:MAG TPA: hypothetical protein VIM11_03385 [Tepidisphaeraceae bacterium]|jgi:proteic killer suppression protein